MRIASIDILRGIVMVLMVVDHAREYSSGPGQVSDPMQLDKVTPLLFVLRWLSHFCAPVFAFLMGVSAGFRPVPRHMIIRGLVLIVLEFTVIDWSWNFYPLWHRKFWQVIGALGASSILLGLLAPLGRRFVLGTGLVILAFHNLFDGLSFAPGSTAHYVWSFVHQRNVLPLFAGFEVRTSYPFLPVAAVAMIGFGISAWFHLPDVRRRLVLSGAATCILFLLLRITTSYGDSSIFEPTGGFLRTLQSLGNVTKYPFSLQFVLMTLGPAMLLLAALHNRVHQRWLETLGQVPLFFYVSHLYALHGIALMWALSQGFALADPTKRLGWVPEGFGFPLWVALPFAAGTTLLLLPTCGWVARLRASKQYSVLRYF